ncbi:hypothetical protein DFR69_103143 [Nocardia neocaledoniensis]|uniref:Uncharacterized protein n=1 Tax=Nocardia neocaledoniensis TaxID=236511 RepID=A0A317NR16_9NOCA|nr:hypothetical protein DFR69_103143 [Nocardia neocaledoniensis]
MKVLEYGASITFAGIACTSATDGVRCTHGDRYFRISSDSYEFG